MISQVYVNQGPDYSWHLHRYDQLKPFDFAIHRAIDGYIRKVIWLKVLISNYIATNKIRMNIRNIYLSWLEKLHGRPIKIITDLSTEKAY